MKDGIKVFILIVVLIAIVALCIYYGKDQVVDVQNEVQDENVEIIEENEEDENVEEEPVEEPVEEKKDEDEKDENITSTVLKQNTGSQIYEDPESVVGSTSEKQKAINLVKAQWGEDTTVVFDCDHVTDDGEYVVAVVSLVTAEVQNYFKVNVETGDVEVEY
jgi:hypothetical protein